MFQRRVSWVRIGVLGFASLRCGTPSAADPLADAPAATSDTSVPADSPLSDPAALAPTISPIADTSLPEVGGQTGDDSGSIGLECDLVTETRLALGDSSRLGFSASERIALVLGTHEMPMRWVEPVYDANGTLLDYAARGTSSLRVEVELSSHEARLLERRDSLYDVDCEPRLLADARLTLSSADGALADTADAVLELGSSTGIVNLSTVLPVAALRGSYAFEPPELGGQAPSRLFISVAFTRYGQAGALAQQYGEGTGATALMGAEWPDWQPCNTWGRVPASYAEPRPTLSDLLGDVQRLAPVILLAPGGESTPAQIELEAVPDSGCHLPPTDPAGESSETLSVQAQVTLTSDALPGPVRVPLDLVSHFSQNTERYGFFSSASTACGTTSYYSPRDFVTHCGDWGLDLTGVDSVSLEVESVITPASGYLLFHLRGMRAPGCTPGPQGFVCPEGTPGSNFELVELGDVRVVLGTP